MQSHDHGYGRFRRLKWGAKEDCTECMEAEKRMAQARAEMGIPYQPLTETCEVDEDGIIRDVDEVNVLLQGDDRPSFAPTVGEIVAGVAMVVGIWVLIGVL